MGNGLQGYYFLNCFNSRPVNRTKPIKRKAAKPTRHNTMVKGVIFSTAISTKKKDAPQIIERVM
ncbi:MAG: hypothetical protein PF503_15085 [Desulfobacula sp.]|nr:hypothetical protein [Desulfobacula sp.]